MCSSLWFPLILRLCVWDLFVTTVLLRSFLLLNLPTKNKSQKFNHQYRNMSQRGYCSTTFLPDYTHLKIGDTEKQTMQHAWTEHLWSRTTGSLCISIIISRCSGKFKRSHFSFPTVMACIIKRWWNNLSSFDGSCLVTGGWGFHFHRLWWGCVCTLDSKGPNI